jgi:hypothetical protein
MLKGIMLPFLLFIIAPTPEIPTVEKLYQPKYVTTEIGWKTVVGKPLYVKRIKRWIVCFLRTGIKNGNKFGRYIYEPQLKKVFIPFQTQELIDDIETAFFMDNTIPALDLEEVFIVQMEIKNGEEKEILFYVGSY